jgi:hypothetical protein
MKTKIFRPYKKEQEIIYTILWQPNGPGRITLKTTYFSDNSVSKKYEWSSEDDLRYITNWERYPSKYSEAEALAAANAEWQKAVDLVGQTVVSQRYGDGFKFKYQS